MSWSAKTYTFSPSTTIKSAEVNQNFDDLVGDIDIAMPSSATGHGIIAFSGAIASIPTGWYLCNGSNGTPDLRDRFIIGAGSTYAVGTTGGTTTKNIQHTHTYSGTTATSNSDARRKGSDEQELALAAHTHTYSGTSANGGSTTQDIMPPYYALAWIMKS
jgi:hypothetical protein